MNVKRQDELVEIQKFEDRFGNRCTAHGLATTCDVHRDGNDFCQDIAGMQTRQTLQR